MRQALPPVGKETHRSLEKHGRGIRTDCNPRANNRLFRGEKGVVEAPLTEETPS